MHEDWKNMSMSIKRNCHRLEMKRSRETQQPKKQDSKIQHTMAYRNRERGIQLPVLYIFFGEISSHYFEFDLLVKYS